MHETWGKITGKKAEEVSAGMVRCGPTASTCAARKIQGRDTPRARHLDRRPRTCKKRSNVVGPQRDLFGADIVGRGP